jgi:ribosomal protein L37AE/L43A
MQDLQYLQTSGKYSGQMRKNFSNEEFNQICSLTPWIEDTSRKSLRERVFCILNNITETPKCPVCNKDNIFLRNGAYSNTCSPSCGIKNPEVQEKTKLTKLEKYGSETFVNPDKAKNTCQERYGVEHTSKLPENREGAKQTNFERNGSRNYNNRERSLVTCLERYGVENAFQSEEVKDKIKASCVKRFDVEYSAQAQVV